MTRRYGLLVVLTLVAALALVAIARRPRRAPPPPAPAPALPSATLALAFEDGRLAPERAVVPKDHQVLLAIENRDGDTLTLELAGYGDRVRVDRLAPGAVWRDTFVTELPGEGFAWLRAGQPVGVLAVTGSHLEEGHR